MLELIKAFFLGIIEGITEWLPISSTGHMLLFDEFVKMDISSEFKEMFFVVIQLAAILAVILIFFKKMWPFSYQNKKLEIKKDTFNLWFKVVLACIPGAIVTIMFDDYVEAHFQTPVVIACALIFYGIAFLFVETWNKNRKQKAFTLEQITYKDALLIGLFQVLSIIPGTSRSGATILGALLLGISRTASAEFTFFLAVPVMLGLSALKILKFGLIFTSTELMILLVGSLTAFVVSLLVVKFLMNYIKKHDFKIFGYYRILLGIIVLIVL